MVSPEPRQTEDVNLPQTASNVTEEPKNTAMEISSVETAVNLTSKAMPGSQSEEPSHPVPMEVDLSAPSSGFTSTEQTPDNSQTPSVVSSNEQREGLETKQTVETLEKNNSEPSGQDVKEKEEMENSEDNKLPLLSSETIGDRETVEPFNKEDVLGGTCIEMENLAEQETVSYLESTPREETEKVKSPEKLEKSSSEEEIQEGAKSITNVEDTKITADEASASKEKTEVDTEPEKMETSIASDEKTEVDIKKEKMETARASDEKTEVDTKPEKMETANASDEKTEADSKPEKMETDEAPTDSTENVKMTENASVVSPTPPGDPVTAAADPAEVSARGVAAVENKKAPLTEEQQAKKKELMALCIRALEYCLRRFPQHHKSRYRLAYVYYYSPEHKVTQYCVTLY